MIFRTKSGICWILFRTIGNERPMVMVVEAWATTAFVFVLGQAHVQSEGVMGRGRWRRGEKNKSHNTKPSSPWECKNGEQLWLRWPLNQQHHSNELGQITANTLYSHPVVGSVCILCHGTLTRLQHSPPITVVIRRAVATSCFVCYTVVNEGYLLAHWRSQRGWLWQQWANGRQQGREARREDERQLKLFQHHVHHHCHGSQ